MGIVVERPLLNDDYYPAGTAVVEDSSGAIVVFKEQDEIGGYAALMWVAWYVYGERAPTPQVGKEA